MFFKLLIIVMINISDRNYQFIQKLVDLNLLTIYKLLVKI